MTTTLAGGTATATSRPERPGRRGASLERKRQRVGWLFVTPFLVVFALFLVFPLFYAFGMSLFTSTLATGTKFTGLANYGKAFTDPLFLEGMLRVAGQVGDGVILNWLSPDDVPRSVGVVREAARRAGRDADAIEVTARLFINLDPPGPESDLVVRRHIAGYLNVPVYRAFQEWLGRTEALGPMWAAWSAGDRKGAVAAIPDQVMSDLMPRGDLAQLKARIQLYLDRGIDTAFLSLMTSEPDAKKKRDLMLNALRALAPGRAATTEASRGR